MEFLLVLAAALAPAILLFFYIRKKDEKRPEPVGMLLKAFGGGILSVILAIILALVFKWLGLYVDTYNTYEGAVRYAFFGAALPEELMKFFIFWLVVRKNRFFDERVDGIVYASCVALGFAALENIFYLFGNYDSWVTVGIVRALFSVPGHFFFGVLMGYYYALVKFKNPSIFNMCMVLAAPIFAHTVFDTILMSMGLNPLFFFLLLAFFIIFFVFLRKKALRSIKEQLQEDDRAFEVLEAESAELPVVTENPQCGVSVDASFSNQESLNEQPANNEEAIEDYIYNKYIDTDKKA